MKALLPLIAVVVMAGAPPASARDITLPDALALARTHALEVMQAEAERDAAEAAAGAARSARFPTLNATALAFYNTEVASFTLALPTGSLEREMGTKENYQTDLRLTLPLFTGGQITSGIEAADASRRYREALVAARENEVYYATRVEYLNVYRAGRLIEAARQSARRADVIARNVASLYEAGAADSVAILEASLAQNDAQSRLEQATHERRSAEIRLCQLLGLPADETLTLTTPIPEPFLPAQIDAADDKPELVAAREGIALNRAEVRRAQAEWWPTLSAFGGYSYGKPNLDRFNNTWNDYWQVGAQMQWSFNLGGSASRRVRQARFRVTAAERSEETVGEDLQRQRLLAWESLRLAWDQYETARRRHAITQDNYRLAEVRHSQGVLTSNRLVEIEATLSESEAALAAAEAGFFIARSAYLYALGSDKLMEGF